MRASLAFLQDVWDELVRDVLLVRVPVLAVLGGAPRVVSVRPVEEQDGQEDHVEVGHGVVEEGGHRPEEGAQNFRNVVEMSGDAPPAGDQQEGLLRLAVARLVLGLDELRGLAPDLGLALGGSEDLSLLIRSPVDVDHEHTKAGNGGRNWSRQVRWMLNEVEGRAGVDAWHPDEAAPADVKSGSVVGNVHGTKVARLPQEELEDVDVGEHDADQHGVRDASRGLQLLGHEAERQDRPPHQTHPAVGPLLDVKALSDPWVELRAPKVVEQEAPGGPGVGAAGKVAPLDGEEQAKDQGKDVQGVQNLSELVVDPGRAEDLVPPSEEERDEGQEEALHPVRLVHGPVSLGGNGADELLAGDGQLQEGLERAKGRDVGRRLPRDSGEGCRESWPIARVGHLETKAGDRALVLDKDAPERHGERRRGHQEQQSAKASEKPSILDSSPGTVTPTHATLRSRRLPLGGRLPWRPLGLR
mmetsp:Transcript_25099/g.53816  ORF Transcript_25099/g.53816 Transcript_25099/m.53816 type:complete len:471 (+) Transcript_25099:39-1451(+)